MLAAYTYSICFLLKSNSLAYDQHIRYDYLSKPLSLHNVKETIILILPLLISRKTLHTGVSAPNKCAEHKYLLGLVH